MLQLEQTQQSKNISFSQKAGFFLLYTAPEQANRGFTRFRQSPLFRFVPLLLMALLLTGCEEGGTIPQSICDAYNNSLYTIRLAGGASLVIGVAFLGFKKQISTILPSQGAQTGVVASSIIVGALLLALTTDIAGQVFGTLGLPNINEQC
jgi:hypothetical protein